MLHALASDLQDHVIDLVTAATFSVVATAMIQHAGQGWAPHSSTCETVLFADSVPPRHHLLRPRGAPHSSTCPGNRNRFVAGVCH